MMFGSHELAYYTALDTLIKRKRFTVGCVSDGAGQKLVSVTLRSNEAVTYSQSDAQELADLINAAADACEPSAEKSDAA